MEILPLKLLNAPNPSYYTKLWNQLSTKHMHTSFEILIQLKGQILNTVNESSRKLIAGNVVFMRPNDWHTIEVLPNETHLHRDIYISNEKMRKICDFLEPTLFKELTESSDPIYFDISANKIQILESKLVLFNEKKSDSLDQESLHTCIIFELLSDYIYYRTYNELSYPTWLQKFLTYVNTPDIMSLKISDLTKFTGYSREHLGREFKKYIGQTLESYMTELRLNYSLSLLSETDFSIAYIAQELGYDSQNSFTNNFRKQFGITPMLWRKNHLPPPEKLGKPRQK